MAGLRPPLHSTSSSGRMRSPSREQDRVQLQSREPRIRSRSRSHNPKPYNPDSPKHYRSNECRSRKPPQSPKVEDGGCGDDGVRMRGILEQKPMIIDLDSHGEPLPFETTGEAMPVSPPSSDDSYSGSESRTSSNTTEPEKSKRPPLDRRSPNPSASPSIAIGRAPQVNDPRRISRPKLDTDFHQYNSSPARLPRYEGARPQNAPPVRGTRPQDPRHVSAEQIPSTAPLGTKDRRSEPRCRSPRPLEPQYFDQRSRNFDQDRRDAEYKKRARPTLDQQRSSGRPLPGSSVSSTVPSQHHRQHVQHSSDDESENTRPQRSVNHTKHLPEHKSMVSLPNTSNERPSNGRGLQEKIPSPKIGSSPPHTPVAAENAKWGQSLNRNALLNVSAALAGAGAVLESHHRKASPRSSPQPSPNHSPYPSPPRTPPESKLHQAGSATKRIHDSPRSHSRPTSPITPTVSSPKFVDVAHMEHHSDGDPRPTQISHVVDRAARPVRPLDRNEQVSMPEHPSLPVEQEARPSRSTPRPVASSPLPIGRHSETDLPTIDVRSPSPLPVRPIVQPNLSSQEMKEPRTPSRYVPEHARASTLMPSRPERRQRSLSNVDARGSRPSKLTIDPIAAPVIHQADVEYLSPTSENTPSHFHDSPQHMGRPSLRSETTVDGHSRTSSFAEQTPSNQHHRSSISSANLPAPRANSAAPNPINGHRSRSAAPTPRLALSDQPDPGPLPRCPRPDHVTGYNDWLTLEGCDYFAICPDCRHSIFGQGYERFFKPQSSRYQGRKTHCHMNDPWVRMACIASISSKQPDASLLIKLAKVSQDYESCPGPTPAERDWYHVEDENADDDDDHLADFQVCTHCVHSVEALLPNLKGTFFRYKGHQVDSTPRPCSLRFDNARFGQYIDKCEKAAQESLASRTEPDMSDFVWYHKKETVIGECTRDQVLIGRDWHLNALIPEFAICELCYYDTVRPLMAPPRAFHLATTVSPVAKHISDGVSCQLYSPRMKEIFERACREDDEEYLRTAVSTRRKLQVEILAARMAVQSKPSEWAVQRDLDDLMDNWRRLEKKRH